MIIKLIQPKMIMRPMDTKLKTRMSPSLALLTIANILSNEHKFIIENENIDAIDFNEHVDIVGITVTMTSLRMEELQTLTIQSIIQPMLYLSRKI